MPHLDLKSELHVSLIQYSYFSSARMLNVNIALVFMLMQFLTSILNIFYMGTFSYFKDGFIDDVGI